MAARSRDKLSDRAVRAAKTPGWISDGAGLYLVVEASGSKRWAYVFQWEKRRAEMGLGSLVDVGLGEARDLRDAARKLLKEGVNPIEARRLEREAAAAPPPVEPEPSDVVTFGAWAKEIAPVIGPSEPKAAKQWLTSVTKNAPNLQKLAVNAVATEDILQALKPYWNSRPETGRRMRNRFESILDAAKAKGHILERSWINPARWKGHLEHLLERRRPEVKHHDALPYADAAKFMVDLRQLDRRAALALELTILTIVRSDNVLGAEVREFDLDAALWTIPKERMKGVRGKKREHVVPLTPEAVAVVRRILDLPRLAGDPGVLLLPSAFKRGAKMTPNAMESLMHDMGFKGVATPHGFRSTFRDWAGDCTNFSREIVEMCLAHVVKDETERAYRRSDALMKRRKVMEAWAGYLARPAAGNVVSLGGVRRR